jgi:hypothetical protein
MNDIVEVLGLAEALERGPIAYFEVIYTQLLKHAEGGSLATELEERIYAYFSDLSLPEEPTLYDHLLLSLRSKDCVATFNWDPLLFLAAARLHRQRPDVRLPYLVFLHGNVAIGHCAQHRVLGSIDSECSSCGEPLEASRLIYPVDEKNYTTDVSIDRAWRSFRGAMEETYVLTIFGYSAPVTDVAAQTAMREAWGQPGQRNLEQIEMIDIEDEEELQQRWAAFILEHHYDVTPDFYASWLGMHPRRTCEAVWSQFMEMEFFTPDPLSRNGAFSELWEWYDRLAPGEGSESSTTENR